MKNPPSYNKKFFALAVYYSFFMKRTVLFFLLVIGSIAIFNSCQKEYSFETPIAAADAKGSLTDSLGNCLYDSVHGTFYGGVTPGGDTAYVELQVKVDSVGNYRIYTDLQNGFMFADSGFFNTTGINTVKLKPIGTPLLQTVTDFAVTFSGDTCHFVVYVKDSTGSGVGSQPWSNSSDTAWSFTTDTTYNGPFEEAYIGVDTVTGDIYLALTGPTAITTDSSRFYLDVLLPNGVIATGTYNTNAGSHIFFDNSPNNDSVFVYYANSTTEDVNTVINISRYDTASSIITGTFTGTAIDPLGNPVTITNGRFKAKVQ